MKTAFIYEIRLEGHVPEGWSEWFDGLTIRNETNGEAVLEGNIADQAALMGLLTRVLGLNIGLISLTRRDVVGENLSGE